MAVTEAIRAAATEAAVVIEVAATGDKKRRLTDAANRQFRKSLTAVKRRFSELF
jgi:hypothetical protein